MKGPKLLVALKAGPVKKSNTGQSRAEKLNVASLILSRILAAKLNGHILRTSANISDGLVHIPFSFLEWVSDGAPKRTLEIKDVSTLEISRCRALNMQMAVNVENALKTGEQRDASASKKKFTPYYQTNGRMTHRCQLIGRFACDT